jgi:hypothetical protein
MDTHVVVRSQYLAALEMLKQAVVRCPGPLWEAPEDKAKFWHVAYHALFYTHLYLQNSEQDFHPWERHRKDYEFMGPKPWPPHDLPEIGEAYAREDVLDYLAFVQEQVDRQVPTLDMESGSGFSWLPFDKFELQIYAIRHIQQHTGELYERLGARAALEMDWVGQGPVPQA